MQSPRAPPTLQAHSGVTLRHPGVFLWTQHWSLWHSLNMDKERGRRWGSPPTSRAAGEDWLTVCSSITPAVWKHVPIHKWCLQMQLLHLILQMEHRQTEAIAVHSPGQHKPALLPNPGMHSHPCNTSRFSKVSARTRRHFSSPSDSFLAVQFLWSLLVWVNSARIYTFELR